MPFSIVGNNKNNAQDFSGNCFCYYSQDIFNNKDNRRLLLK